MTTLRLTALAAVVLATACSSEREAALPLAPVPYAMKVPAGILPRLSCGPIDEPFGAQVTEAGALASATVYYSPLEEGEKVIFLTAFWFPEDRFDVLQNPDTPPPFGFEVVRAEGKVLSIAGPLDSIFAPDTPDGKNLIDLYGAIYLPETYRATE